MHLIYLIKNTLNFKVYVGQTKFTLEMRKKQHLYGARKNWIGKNRCLYASIRKYGEEVFEFSVLEECLQSDINEKEVKWIEFFDSTNREKGYNLSKGGNHKHEYKQLKPLSEETRQKLSLALKGKPLSQKQKEFYERVKKEGIFAGSNNPMHGKKGEKSPNSKLTQEQANEIRRRLSYDRDYRKIAKDYGVSKNTIYHIRDNESYVE